MSRPQHTPDGGMRSRDLDGTVARCECYACVPNDSNGAASTAR